MARSVSALVAFRANSQLHAHAGCDGCPQCDEARRVRAELVDIETIAPDDEPESGSDGDAEDQ